MVIDFLLSAPLVAKQLIGHELTVYDKHGERGGIIVETEAYTSSDPASHSYGGQTTRNEAMFMSPGTIYVYRIYGIHFCLNIVCGSSDGQAVLIRALKPTKGIAFMQKMRGVNEIAKLTNGPAKLVQALDINAELNMSHLSNSNIILASRTQPYAVKTSPRIGVSKGVDVLWRFYV